MIRVYVDGKEVPISPESLGSLDGIVRTVEKTCLQPDAVIRQIQLDGEPLLSEELEQDPSSALDRIRESEKLEIVTGKIHEVAQASIREALSYLDRIETATPSLALSFRATPGPEAFENLGRFYEGFYWMNLLLDRLHVSLGISMDTLIVEGQTARAQYEKLASLLRELIASQERGDFVLLSDLLEYEILPMLPVFRNLFSSLNESVSVPS